MGGGGNDSRIAPNMTAYEANEGQLDIGDYPTFRCDLPSDATGNVVIGLPGEVYEGISIMSFDEDLLAAGTHTVTAYYSGDSKYLPDTDTITYTITKIPSFIVMSVPIDNGETIYALPTITVTAPSDATGTVTLSLKDLDNNTTDTYTIFLVDGSGSYDMSNTDINPGDYELTAIYNGDDKYLPCSEYSDEHGQSNSVTFTYSYITVNPDPGTIYVEP